MTQGTVSVRTAAVGALCVGTGCRRRCETKKGRRVVAGSRLCRACRDDLAARLESLPGLYSECERLLGGSNQPRSDVSGGSMPGIPFNAAAADIRATILRVLGSWSGMVVEERRVIAPRRSVGALVEFLGRHVDWIAAHVAAAEAMDEVTQLVRSARRVAYPNPIRRVAIGACVEVSCAGELVAFVHTQEPTLPAKIRCDANPCHSWLENQWMQLSRRMGTAPSITASTTRWLSAADISRLWSISPGSVYRLASEQRWRRRNQGGRTYYHEMDILHAFSQRKSRSGQQ